MEKASRQLYRVRDPYEGDWYLVPGTEAVFGIYGEIDESALDLILAGIDEAEEAVRE